ncbi:hypothetical protein J6590_024997 [Homalodisca vitripennis]|nr:hypothetical protein J6590_024997 [Homalodisca vitripennis]
MRQRALSSEQCAARYSRGESCLRLSFSVNTHYSGRGHGHDRDQRPVSATNTAAGRAASSSPCLLWPLCPSCVNGRRRDSLASKHVNIGDSALFISPPLYSLDAPDDNGVEVCWREGYPYGVVE